MLIMEDGEDECGLSVHLQFCRLLNLGVCLGNDRSLLACVLFLPVGNNYMEDFAALVIR